MSAPPAIPGFEAQARLAVGATAQLWAAIETSTGRPVVLKLPKRPDQAAREVWKREAALLAWLARSWRGPAGICRLLAWREHAGLPCLVLERIVGRELGELAPTLPLAARLRLASELAGVVAGLHRRGVVHGDLKPANVMVQALPGEGLRPMLVDFGLARSVGEEGAADLPLGTPPFLAPERILDPRSAADPRVDVYALGALAFELLTGTPVFQGRRVDLLLATVSSPVPSLGALAPGVPVEVGAIVERCLAKEPRRRYRSARALERAWRWAIASSGREVLGEQAMEMMHPLLAGG